MWVVVEFSSNDDDDDDDLDMTEEESVPDASLVTSGKRKAEAALASNGKVSTGSTRGKWGSGEVGRPDGATLK